MSLVVIILVALLLKLYLRRLLLLAKALLFEAVFLEFTLNLQDLILIKVGYLLKTVNDQFFVIYPRSACLSVELLNYDLALKLAEVNLFLLK